MSKRMNEQTQYGVGKKPHCCSCHFAFKALFHLFASNVALLVLTNCVLLPGVLWLVKQNKLIVTGFARGSAAREAGVRAGDILKAVDDIDVFHMAHATLVSSRFPADAGQCKQMLLSGEKNMLRQVSNSQGVNPVGQLLSGPVNSVFALRLDEPAPGYQRLTIDGGGRSAS